jgi:hypothetical protein
LGITNQFWSLGDPLIAPAKPLAEASVIINQALADELDVSADQVSTGAIQLTIRIPKQHQLPADSAMGKQDDLIESLVDLTVAEIIPTDSLGRFGLHPTQADPLNVYHPIEL